MLLDLWLDITPLFEDLEASSFTTADTGLMPLAVRNPFRRGGENGHGLGIAAGPANGTAPPAGNANATSDAGPAGQDATAAADAAYKLSVVDGSGVYLPPSPEEKTSFWGSGRSKKSSTRHSTQRPVVSDEHFSISRESFDGYRRSFDISATSPVVDPSSPRMSLDSHWRSFTPAAKTSAPPPPPVDEPQEFEDVGLDDDEDGRRKKRGIFSRFTASASSAAPLPSNQGSPGRSKKNKDPNTAELDRL